MRYRLNHVEIIDPNSTWNHKTKDIIIDEGVIREAQKSDQAEVVIEAKGLHLLPALCETYASIGDPGHEYREDIQSVSAAAAHGGVTSIYAIADNIPVTDNKTHVEYIVKSTQDNLVQIWPMGAVTEQLKGSDPTEMYDMHYAGAVGFSDAPHSINNSGVLLRALQYASPFEGVISVIPYDNQISREGQINEGKISVEMGMKGIPHMAEYLRIHRDIELLAYAGGHLHINGVSTAEGVDLIKKAKARGLHVTASVFLHNLLFTEESVQGFDTNYKVFPPLRTSKDQKVLLKAVKDGSIDLVSTQHVPLDTESKRLEFEYALPGMANIEFAFAIAWKALGGDLEQIVESFSIRPRAIFNRKVATIEPGVVANVILVDTKETYTIPEALRKSKSANSPFYGQQLQGQVKAVFNNGQSLRYE